MHFEILVEDLSGKIMLASLIPMIIGADPANTFRIIHYRGCGSLPSDLKVNQAADKRALLNQLPRLLIGYSRAFQNAVSDNAVIVVCDLDTRDKDTFLARLNQMRDEAAAATSVPLTVRFCLAIEEGEAWLLGDWEAVKQAYPQTKASVFRKYQNDAVCGTWEMLADMICPGGSAKLKAEGHSLLGQAKCEWAEKISPLMDISRNKSPSFNVFKSALESLLHLPHHEPEHIT